MPQKQLTKKSATTAPTTKFENKPPMAESRRKRPNGYWQDLDNVINELKPLLAQHGSEVVLKHDWLHQHGHSSLSKAIVGSHGGFLAIRATLFGSGIIQDPSNPQRPSGYWKDFSHVIEAMQPFIEQHGADMVLNSTWLNSNDQSSLCFAIIAYHGGFQDVRTKLHEQNIISSFTNLRRARHYWHNFENLAKELQPILVEYGPKAALSSRWLQTNGFSSVQYSIRYHGGVSAVRLRLQVEGLIPSIDQEFAQANLLVESALQDILV